MIAGHFKMLAWGILISSITASACGMFYLPYAQAAEVNQEHEDGNAATTNVTITGNQNAPATTSIPEPDGYRLEEYDAPVPDGLTGAIRVDAIDVRQLQAEKNALVIDVIPAHRKPEFLPDNQIWIPPVHKGIPGSVWLPDVGYGVLSDTTVNYLTSNLEKHTNSNLQHPIIFYCRLDCWMSWNAAKRALDFGYTNVYWFADGIDGWTFEDFELQILSEEPGVRQ